MTPFSVAQAAFNEPATRVLDEKNRGGIKACAFVYENRGGIIAPGACATLPGAPAHVGAAWVSPFPRMLPAVLPYCARGTTSATRRRKSFGGAFLLRGVGYFA